MRGANREAPGVATWPHGHATGMATRTATEGQPDPPHGRHSGLRGSRRGHTVGAECGHERPVATLKTRGPQTWPPIGQWPTRWPQRVRQRSHIALPLPLRVHHRGRRLRREATALPVMRDRSRRCHRPPVRRQLHRSADRDRREAAEQRTTAAEGLGAFARGPAGRLAFTPVLTDGIVAVRDGGGARGERACAATLLTI